MYSSKQNGVALIIVLIFLAIMMLLAVTSLRTSTLDERLAANYQFSTVTDQAAELAVSEVLRHYQKDVDTGNMQHIFRKVWDSAQRKQYFPGYSYQKLTSLIGTVADNSNAAYRAEVLWKSDKYPRAGDATNIHSMLFYLEGESKYADNTGANARHRLGVSVRKVINPHMTGVN